MVDDKVKYAFINVKEGYTPRTDKEWQAKCLMCAEGYFDDNLILRCRSEYTAHAPCDSAFARAICEFKADDVVIIRRTEKGMEESC